VLAEVNFIRKLVFQETCHCLFNRHRELIMKFTHSVLSFVFPLLFVSNAWSDDQADHKEHHPASATASAKSAATVPVASASKNGVKKSMIK
jgi:hypothetical protein